MSMYPEKICEMYSRMVNERANWENYWEEIAERILPRQSETFLTYGRNLTQGDRRNERMVDASGAIALERFAAVMESMLTPMHQIWHRLKPSNTDLARERDVQVYMDVINRILWEERKRSSANFQSQCFEGYMSLGAFGSGVTFIDGHNNAGLRYQSVHLSEVYFDTNFQGIIDTAMRRLTMTGRQLLQRVDAGRFEPLDSETERYVKSKMDEKLTVLHLVKPRENRDPERMDGKGMEFASYYVLEDRKVLLSEGGYAVFPYAISRYVIAPGEKYGRSPAMTALPSINTLNEQKKTVLKQGHRSVDPILLAHDDGVLDSFSLKPGALNAGGVSAEGRPLVQTLPVGNPILGMEMMEAEKAVINDVFLVSIFQILIDRRGQTPPTATEVLELAKEKGSLLAPTMGRQQSEMLGPMIERELDLLSKQGLLPDMPEAMLEAEGEFEIEYESPLSRAQRAEEAAGLFRTIEFAATYANVTQDPSAFDWIDIDTAMPQVMEINGVPAAWRKSMDQVMSEREGRNQQAQQAQMIEAAPAAAQLIKAVGPNVAG